MSQLIIRRANEADREAWDSYVLSHLRGTLYHLYGWKKVIEATYGHKAYYLLAVQCDKGQVESDTPEGERCESDSGRVRGILPLINIKHLLLGNSLISMPFFDMGGILADDEGVEKTILMHAIGLGREVKANTIELRHIEPLSWISDCSEITTSKLVSSTVSHELPSHHEKQNLRHEKGVRCTTRSQKVLMQLDVSRSPDALMKSLKSKLRSQIKKPMKDGLISRIGDLDLLDKFYKVFSINMRDLGSPVHSKKLMQNVLREFPEEAKIITVEKENEPLAVSFVIGFRDILENPWASSLREYSRLAPNMLLYWSMLEYACNNEFKCFDFGRSSPGEGTYKFKEQWGSTPRPLHWHYITFNDKSLGDQVSEKDRFNWAMRYWQKLPVSVTRVLGPRIRRYIGL